MNIPQRLLVLALILTASLGVQGQTSWNESAQSMGIFHQTTGSNYGSGACFYDFNQDGKDDLTLGSGIGDSISFYLNTGSGFQKIPALVPDVVETKQVLWVDYDNDGDADLFTTSDLGRNRLYQNNGNLNLSEVTFLADLPMDSMPTWTAVWGDYDRDGWLDLYVTTYVFGTPYAYSNYLFRNGGNGAFQNVTMTAHVSDSNKSPLAVAFVDYDNDHWPDLYIAQDKFHGNVMLKNQGDGSFEDVSAATGADRTMDGMCVAVGDYNKTGFFDLYVTNSPWGNSLFVNNGNGTFTDTATATGTGFYGEGWASTFYDFDNDSWQDLYVSGAFPGSWFPSASYYHNTGNGLFSEPTNVGMIGDTTSSYSHAVGDANNDGYPDIIVNNRSGDSTQLWMNNGGSMNWIKVELEGTASNRDAIGAKMEIWCNGDRQIRYTHCGIGFLGQNTDYEIIGVNTATIVDSLIIEWPSGHRTNVLNVPINQKIKIVEGDYGTVHPQIFRSGSDTLCRGSSIRLYAPRFDSYLWSNGDTTASIYVNTPGSYTVQTVDANGNLAISDTFQLFMQQPEFDFDFTSVSCFGEMDGSAVVTNAEGPYDYLWNQTQTGTTLTGLGPGSNTLIVTDSTGCAYTRNFYISEPTELEVSTTETPDIDNMGTGTATANPTGGMSPYIYLWDDPQAQTGATATGLMSGDYLVIVTDSNGCMDSSEVTVGLITGMEETLREDGLEVWPNPAAEEVHVRLKTSVAQIDELILLDINGKVHVPPFTKENGREKQLTLQVDRLQSGVYVLRIAAGDRVWHRKLIILKKK